MLKLNNSLSIYLMKKDNSGKDLSDLNNDIIKELSDTFGGCTVVDGQGYWIDNDTLYKDDNIIVECNYSELSKDMINAFLNAINKEFKEGKQLAVSVELNKCLYILENQKDIKKLLDKVKYNVKIIM